MDIVVDWGYLFRLIIVAGGLGGIGLYWAERIRKAEEKINERNEKS